MLDHSGKTYPYPSIASLIYWSQQGNSHETKNIREIKFHVYGKRQTSYSSWEFLKIKNKQIKTVQNNSYG